MIEGSKFLPMMRIAHVKEMDSLCDERSDVNSPRKEDEILKLDEFRWDSEWDYRRQ